MKVTRIKAGQYRFWNQDNCLLIIIQNEYGLWWIESFAKGYTGSRWFSTLREAKVYLIKYYNQEKK